jgi:Uma2 family endonuclease
VTIADFTPIADEWTIADLEELPRGVRAEVHNGNLLIMSPARVWHQRIARRIANLLEADGRQADTEIGIYRTARDGRVADVAVFRSELTDPTTTWHSADSVALVLEVWSQSSDEKDRFPHWYAALGIPEYWLAEPINGDKWGALITMYELATTFSGNVEYVERRRATLDELMRDGLG